MRIRNWYSERARLLQEIALQQPITTDHISIRFKKLEGEQSEMVIHVDYEEVKKRKPKTLYIPITDEVLALSYLDEWLSYINTTWCCGSASVTVDNGEDKFIISFEAVVHDDKRKFKNMANDIFETAYFYVYSSKKKRIVLSAYIDSFIFFSHFDSMMQKHIKEYDIFKPEEETNNP